VPAPRLLRAGLLDGACVALAGATHSAEEACAALGAVTCRVDAELRDEAAVAAAVAALAPAPTALVADAAPAFVAAGGGVAGVRAGLDGTWNVMRAVTNAALRPRGAGIAVLVAPRPSAAPLAAALRAALENLARTTAVEWARHGVRVVAVLPGDVTADAEVAELCAFLVSRAGGYFTGCALTLGEAAPDAR
jgi:NAD(P)-dependent dehydrogenase (short-subunit alcohol dehydrogenase family)